MTVESSTISTPSSTFFAASDPESVFVMPRNPRQRPPSVCTDSGWVIRKTAWRTSLAVNGPQLSWNCTPLRSVIVQVLPSGDISHFSASSGMYAPVLRSIPTRYSRAGRLSSMPLRLCSQVKFVSHPRGATATISRSSFPLAGACAQATLITNTTVSTTPHSTPRVPHRGIFPSSVSGGEYATMGYARGTVGGSTHGRVGDERCLGTGASQGEAGAAYRGCSAPGVGHEFHLAAEPQRHAR